MSLKVYTNNMDEYPTYEKNSFIMIVDDEQFSSDGGAGLYGTLLKAPSSHKTDVGYGTWNPSFFCESKVELEINVDKLNFNDKRLYVKSEGDKEDSIIDFINGRIETFSKKDPKVKIVLKNKQQ